MIKIKDMACFLFIWCIISNLSFAQEEVDVMGDSVQDVAIIIGTTLGGAVLGLSTLSFYDEPTDHMKNIVVGGALGIIIGVAAVGLSQASKSKALVTKEEATAHIQTPLPSLDTTARMANHKPMPDPPGGGPAGNGITLKFSF